MSSGSTSSSDSSAPKKKKKSKEKKKSGKDVKKGQKEKKDEAKGRKKGSKPDKKADKKTKAAEAWECDRPEAVRLLGQLLLLDAGIAEELAGVFESIDGGDVVRIDGLENKQAKKKLRHLMHAFRLPPADGQGFRTASKKVSFLALFRSCADKAKQALAKAASASVDSPGAVAALAAAEEASPEAAEQRGAESPSADAAEPQAAGPRKVGPQLPGASVGPAAGEEPESSDEGAEGAGPRVEGAERKGVDLNSIPRHIKRESWMTTPHESIAGAFSSDGPARKRDRFEVTRSKEEQEKFEKIFKERQGPSLLQEKIENKFAGHEEEMEKARKLKPGAGATDIWGMSAKEQERGGAAAAANGALQASRRPFDPEQDMVVKKPITGADFSKMVENSATDLAGRFSRSQVATSFL